MVKILPFVTLSLIAATASGAPIVKRIAQVIDQSTAKWERACDDAGGGLECNRQSVKSFSTLLAAGGPCDQQDQGDNMIDLAKTLKNNADMIRLTQIFVQQARNTPSSESVQYCDRASRNAELNGLFQCQFQGAKPKTFVGGVTVGGPGTIPFGHQSPIEPPGSCPAHPGGPIPDGQQLVNITENPGVPSSGGGGESGSATSNAQAEAVTPSDFSSSGGGDFHKQNGEDAQALNKSFEALSANSPCTPNGALQNACIGTQFAQCVNGEYVMTPCGTGLGCFALPLVNKAGTSIACTTEADANARFEATGVQGGPTG